MVNIRRIPNLNVAKIRTTFCVASLLLLLGCNKSPAPTTFRQGLETVSGLVDSRSKIVGKWHRKYIDHQGGSCTDNLEFFSSGDFSLNKRIVWQIQALGTTSETQAGTYKFIDSTHLKLDYGGAGSEILELISASDRELRIKEGDSVNVWTTGFAASPAQ